MRRRKSRWCVRTTPDQMEQIAKAVLDERQRALADGYALTGSSGVWRRGNGTFTVKLVYRRRSADRQSTLSFTIRGIGHHTLLGVGHRP